MQLFEKYLKLVQKLYSDKHSCQEIANFLNKNNIWELFEEEEDKSELDFEKEAENLMSLIKFRKNDDLEIETIDDSIECEIDER